MFPSLPPAMLFPYSSFLYIVTLCLHPPYALRTALANLSVVSLPSFFFCGKLLRPALVPTLLRCSTREDISDRARQHSFCRASGEENAAAVSRSLRHLISFCFSLPSQLLESSSFGSTVQGLLSVRPAVPPAIARLGTHRGTLALLRSAGSSSPQLLSRQSSSAYHFPQLSDCCADLSACVASP